MHDACITGCISLRLRVMLATISGGHMCSDPRFRLSQTRTEIDGASGQNRDNTDEGEYPDHETKG